MTNPTIRNAGQLAAARAEGVQDLLLVSSFGLWAMLLGLAPVLALRFVIGKLRPLSKALPWLIRGSTCGQMRAKSRPAF